MSDVQDPNRVLDSSEKDGIKLILVAWELSEMSPMFSFEYIADIDIWVKIENNSQESIYGIKASMRFVDMFGEDVFTVGLTIRLDSSLRAGSVTSVKKIRYEGFDAPDELFDSGDFDVGGDGDILIELDKVAR